MSKKAEQVVKAIRNFSEAQLQYLNREEYIEAIDVLLADFQAKQDCILTRNQKDNPPP